MGEWFSVFMDGVTLGRVLMGIGVLLASSVGGLALVSLVLVRMPSNYFHHEHAREFWTDRHHLVRWGGFVAKNVTGFLLVVLGIAMMVLPGPGLLTILIGVILLDIPAKREMERRIVSRPQVLSAINNLRARFSKPPLVLD